MDIFQKGVYYKEVSKAQVDSLVNYFNSSSQAIKSAAAVDWNRSEIRRMSQHMKRLQEELRYVLQQQGISYTSIENMAVAFSDDAVSTAVAETSDKTNYPQVRYQNIPLAIVNELNELARRNSGSTMNRIVNLITEINFARIKIAKMEGDLSNVVAARKEFEDKRNANPGAFESMRDQMIALSAISGYADALFSLVNDYPKDSPTDNTVKTTAEKFDHACIMWRRYKKKLLDSVQNYRDKYINGQTDEPLPKNVVSDMISGKLPGGEELPFVEINEVLKFNYKIVFNSKTNKYDVVDQNQSELIKTIIRFMIDEKEIPPQYTGVPSMRAVATSSLEAMRLALFVMATALEEKIETWSAGTSKIASNPAVAKVIDKAREVLNSPVRRTITDPMTRDEYLSKTLIDFSKVSEQVKRVRAFLESKTDALREKVTKGLQDFDTEFLRKTFLRKAMPVKDYIKGMKPVEDAVRARVRERYGKTVPFEDEVNIAKEGDSPVFVKEQYVEQDPKTGEWHLKSSLALAVLGNTISQTDVSK
jgi:hypothetical protein